MTDTSVRDVVRHERVYAILLSVFVVILVLTNIIGVKLFLAFPSVLGTACFGAAHPHERDHHLPNHLLDHRHRLRALRP